MNKKATLSHLHILGIFMVLFISTVTPGYGDETPNAIVQGEYIKVQNELSVSLVHAKKSLVELANDRKKAVNDAQTQSKLERQGIDGLKKYDLLLTIRYADEKGQYQSSTEISAKDQENLNKLFDTYLRSTPLSGRTSVGNARKMIDWATRRLEELSKIHADPTETNNSDLEIIAQQIRDSDLRIKTVNDLANRLGVKLNESVALAPEFINPEEPTTQAPRRQPASQNPRTRTHGTALP